MGVLKGSFIFLADLVRRMDIPCQVEFVRLSSYGSSAVSSGKIKVVSPLPGSIRGRDVVVVEDIVDSGLTISFLLNYLRRKRPASVKLCAMFVKGSPGDFPFPIDYMGMEIPKEFVVGYGLDFNEEYRYLPDLRILESEAD
ncbi:MAG: hypoxanthine-guanine phosphoribosyltransferase [Dehalococcoidia bacterium]|nr:hypoxanthine-guanine phosphoribosyltransferase [Dehalococcoidia bacterium]